MSTEFLVTFVLLIAWLGAVQISHQHQINRLRSEVEALKRREP